MTMTATPLTGRDVAAERTRHNVSQKDVADHLGIAATHLSVVETGQIEATQEWLTRCIETVRSIAASRKTAA